MEQFVIFPAGFSNDFASEKLAGEVANGDRMTAEMMFSDQSFKDWSYVHFFHCCHNWTNELKLRIVSFYLIQLKLGVTAFSFQHY